MTLADVAAVVGGSAHGEAVVTGPAFVDSRDSVPGGLFVAVPGARVDGHDFAGTAFAAGAAAVLGSRPTDGPTVVVDDVVTALGTLARHVLEQLPDVTVHALTGSQGKTGVKDYLATVLSRDGVTVATAGNFNNEIGVPLTVLRATEATRHLVVEMGARGVGHIAYLCTIAPPDVAAVLNVGTAHIGEFGSQDAIALAKGEIVEALGSDGTAVLNAADHRVAAMAVRTSAPVLTFGDDTTGADVAARNVTADDLGRCSLVLTHAGESAPVRLRQLGAHQVPNALAAAAMARAVGMTVPDVAAALSDAVPASRWRMELHERGDGLVVVNDAYNANPESVRAALQTIGTIGARTGRRTVAVLGEMLELGDGARRAHEEIGQAAALEGVGVLVAIGPWARDTADAFEGEASAGETVTAASRDEALEWLRHNVSAADVVLVKASRGAALEVIADRLLDEPPPETRDEGTSTS